MRITIAVLDKKSNNAPATTLVALQSIKTKENKYFTIASPYTSVIENDILSLQKENLHSSVAIASCSSESPSQGSSLIGKVGDTMFAFEGIIYSPKPKIPFAESITKKSQQEQERAIEGMVEESEGDFAFLVAGQDRIIAARDPIGVRPLYYGENEACVAAGSNRKILWKLGIEKAYSFPPGHVGLASPDGFRFKPVKTLKYKEPKPITIEKATFTLQKLLERSVRLRVQDVTEVAVAFSGGLDSSIVAFLAKKCGANVSLVHVSLRNQAETQEAKKAAEELELPLSVHLFEEEDVENIVGEVVGLIEEPDPVKLAIGIPFYWAAQKTAQAGFKVLLAGQGADELFGGYQRYVHEYCLHGEEKTRRTMFADVVGMYKSNLERDAKICGFHDVELRLPFASYNLVEFDSGLPMKLKIEAKTDTLRKLILRRTAETVGLPAFITRKPKKAVQYSTGINSVLKKIAKKKALSVKSYVSWLFGEI